MRQVLPTPGGLAAAITGIVAVAAALVLPAGPVAVAKLPPPLEVEILDATEASQGQALVYLNFVELLDAGGTKQGAIGVVWTQGRTELFLVQADTGRTLIGWASNHRLYNTEDELVGFYFWTPIWSYVYDPDMNKVGQAQCIAYQGVCAAGIAGYLLGLL